MPLLGRRMGAATRPTADNNSGNTPHLVSSGRQTLTAAWGAKNTHKQTRLAAHGSTACTAPQGGASPRTTPCACSCQLQSRVVCVLCRKTLMQPSTCTPCQRNTCHTTQPSPSPWLTLQTPKLHKPERILSQHAFGPGLCTSAKLHSFLQISMRSSSAVLTYPNPAQRRRFPSAHGAAAAMAGANARAPVGAPTGSSKPAHGLASRTQAGAPRVPDDL